MKQVHTYACSKFDFRAIFRAVFGAEKRLLNCHPVLVHDPDVRPQEVAGKRDVVAGAALVLHDAPVGGAVVTLQAGPVARSKVVVTLR